MSRASLRDRAAGADLQVFNRVRSGAVQGGEPLALRSLTATTAMPRPTKPKVEGSGVPPAPKNPPPLNWMEAPVLITRPVPVPLVVLLNTHL
jgi:hypothetical protein